MYVKEGIRRPKRNNMWMKSCSYESDKTLSEWRMSCLHYVLRLIDDVTCSCCHVEGLQSVGPVQRGETANSLGFLSHIYFFVCWAVLIVATTSPCVAVVAGSVSDLKRKKGGLEEGAREGEGETEDRQKERNTLGKNDMAQGQGGH